MKKNTLLTLSMLAASSLIVQIDAMGMRRGMPEEAELSSLSLAARARAMGRQWPTPGQEAAATTPAAAAAATPVVTPATTSATSAAPAAAPRIAMPPRPGRPDIASVKNKLGQARAHFIDLRQTLVAVRKGAADARAAGDTALADELDAEIKGLEEQIQDALPPRIRLMRGGADL